MAISRRPSLSRSRSNTSRLAVFCNCGYDTDSSSDNNSATSIFVAGKLTSISTLQFFRTVHRAVNSDSAAPKRIFELTRWSLPIRSVIAQSQFGLYYCYFENRSIWQRLELCYALHFTMAPLIILGVVSYPYLSDDCGCLALPFCAGHLPRSQINRSRLLIRSMATRGFKITKKCSRVCVGA